MEQESTEQSVTTAVPEKEKIQTEKERLPVKKSHLGDVKLPVKPQQELLPYEKENYSTIEKAIKELSAELVNLSDLKDAIEQSFNDKNLLEDKFQANVTSTFNSLCEKFDEFNEKIKKEIDYRNILEEKIKNNELDGRNLLLQRELEEERAAITKNLSEINRLVKSSLQTVDEKCKELKTADTLIEEAIMKFREDSKEAADNKYKGLVADTNSLIKEFTENARKTLEVVKKHSVDFINQCEKENKSLLAAVPGIKGKMTLESWLVIILGCLGIAGFLLNLLK